MGQILHQRATTTAIIRQKIQKETGSIYPIAKKIWNQLEYSQKMERKKNNRRYANGKR